MIESEAPLSARLDRSVEVAALFAGVVLAGSVLYGIGAVLYGLATRSNRDSSAH